MARGSGLLRWGSVGLTAYETIFAGITLILLFTAVFLFVSNIESFSDTRDVKRMLDITTVSNAISEYRLNNLGILPEGFDDKLRVFGTGEICTTTCYGITTEPECIDISDELVPKYITEIPFDPVIGNELNSGYAVKEFGSGRVLVVACNPESDRILEILR